MIYYSAMKSGFNITLVLLLFASIAIIIVSSYQYYLVDKNLPFVIETECDPTTEKCFHRDCSDGTCPPNELEFYSEYTLNGKDYDSCSVLDGCLTFCRQEPGRCVKTACEDGGEIACIGPIPLGPVPPEQMESSIIIESTTTATSTE